MFTESEEVKEIADQLINTIEDHSHLTDANIAFLFTDEQPPDGNADAVQWGVSKRVPPEVRSVSGYDFTIVINEFVWMALSDEEKEALVDHQLSFCWFKETKKDGKKPVIVNPNVNEFVAVIGRRGFWRPQLQHLKEIVQQMEFEFEAVQ